MVKTGSKKRPAPVGISSDVSVSQLMSFAGSGMGRPEMRESHPPGTPVFKQLLIRADKVSSRGLCREALWRERRERLIRLGGGEKASPGRWSLARCEKTYPLTRWSRSAIRTSSSSQAGSALCYQFRSGNMALRGMHACWDLGILL